MFSEKGDTREDANKNKNEREEKISDGVSNQDDGKNNDLPGYFDFAISDKQKSLGIICVARVGSRGKDCVREGQEAP